jgi:hypothetical protein
MTQSILKRGSSKKNCFPESFITFSLLSFKCNFYIQHFTHLTRHHHKLYITLFKLSTMELRYLKNGKIPFRFCVIDYLYCFVALITHQYFKSSSFVSNHNIFCFENVITMKFLESRSFYLLLIGFAATVAIITVVSVVLVTENSQNNNTSTTTITPQTTTITPQTTEEWTTEGCGSGEGELFEPLIGKPYIDSGNEIETYDLFSEGLIRVDRKL